MRNFCCGLLLLLAAGVLFSCSAKTGEKKFFDVPGYFKNEIEYIKTAETKVSKTSVYNGLSETKEFAVAEINWEKEFGIFLQCDINKPAYYANMSKITTPSHATPAMFGWSDQSEKLPIRYVMIEGYHYGEGGPYQSTGLIRIQINKSNLISETTINALYVRDSIYEFKGVQKIRNLRDKNTFYIKGEFR